VPDGNPSALLHEIPDVFRAFIVHVRISDIGKPQAGIPNDRFDACLVNRGITWDFTHNVPEGNQLAQFRTGQRDPVVKVPEEMDRETDDSGEELYKYIGKKRTVSELIFEMITVSSNLATNILIELVGAKNVTKTMRSIGANDILVLRGVEDGKAYNLGMNNVVTAYDLMLIYEVLANNNFVNDKSSKEMIEILLQQKHNSRIPAKLPDDVKVAHKTGSITGVGHDSGIVFLPDGRKYVLILLSKNVSDEKAMMEAQAEVSRIIYDYIVES